ncbi:MAG: hypothetical protein M3076_07715 [Actinomycetota bacterium]|nr:hypothetical protein [Actinomycetota bacterium]
MHRKHLVALCGAILAVSSFGTAVALAAPGTATTVTVRVEGRTHSLLGPRSVQLPASGWITKGGAPSGKCPAASAQGALDAATRGNWSGKWFGSLSSYEIFTILRDHESGKHSFWEIFVNNVAASAGACGITPKPSDQLLFAVVPIKPTEYPTAIHGPSNALVGAPFKVHVVYFNAAGKAKPLAKAHVTGGGFNLVTNRYGSVTINPKNAGTLVLRTSPAGYVRSTPLTVHVNTLY